MAKPKKTYTEIERENRQLRRTLAAATATIHELQAAWHLVATGRSSEVSPEIQALTDRLWQPTRTEAVH